MGDAEIAPPRPVGQAMLMSSEESGVEASSPVNSYSQDQGNSLGTYISEKRLQSKEGTSFCGNCGLGGSIRAGVTSQEGRCGLGSHDCVSIGMLKMQYLPRVPWD